MWNVYGKIGGDAKLSERGEAYALKLPQLVKESFDVSLDSQAHFFNANTSRVTTTPSRSGHQPSNEP